MRPVTEIVEQMIAQIIGSDEPLTADEIVHFQPTAT
jgi:hypothetical protein